MRPHILHNGLHRIGDQLNHLFDSERFLGIDPHDMLWMAKEQAPLTNIVKNDKAYELKVALPGFKKEEVEVSLNGNVLTIQAEKKTKPADQIAIHRAEFELQRARRQFSLPDNVDADTIHASFEEGILHIRMLYQRSLPYRIIPIS